MLTRFGLMLSFLCLFLMAGAARSEGQGQTGYFISIDGLMPSKLRAAHQAGKLTAPHGLGWLLSNGLSAKRANAVETTLTAASHVSNITCTTPARHGVFANSFLRDNERVSGFGAPIQSETLWQAAKRQGKSVLSMAYVGADGPGAERRATWGISYPEASQAGERQTLEWNWTKLPAAKGWLRLAPLTDVVLKESRFDVLINKATGEKQTVYVLLQEVGRSATYRMWFDSDKNLQNGFLGELTYGNAKQPFLDLYLIESDPNSTLHGYKRRVTLRWMPSQTATLNLHVSKASYNDAYPEEFRRALDHANLVWPDYGIEDEALTLQENVEAQAYIDRFMTRATLLAQSLRTFDIVLFYQPLLDTMGHWHEADLPTPFDPSATDAITAAYMQVLQIIDQNLSKILSRGSDQNVVALVSDHGMSPIIKAVNLAVLLGEDQNDVDVITSGSLTMLYAKVGADPAIADRIGLRLKDKLTALRIENRSALGQSYRKTEVVQQGVKEWQYGQAVWAFLAADGVWTRFKPKKSELYLEVTAPGMHGQPPNTPSMEATFVIAGPGIQPRELPQMSLIDALPTFTDALGIAPPRDCMGHSLLRKSQ